jgi:hypothetical protein
MLNEDELQYALLLVFANKQDLLMVMNTVDITDNLMLGLHGYILESASHHIRVNIHRYPVFVPHSVDLQREELQ